MIRSCLIIGVIVLLLGSTAFAADSAAPEKAVDTISLDLKDVDVRTAIQAVFTSAGKNFSIDQDVQGTIPALSFKEVPLDVALKTLTKTAGLVCRFDSGVYIISKKPEVSTIVKMPETTTGGLAPVDEPITSEMTVEKVPLNYTSASEILALMKGETDTGRAYGSSMMGMYGGYPSFGGGYNGYGGGYNSYGGNNYGGYSPYRSNTGYGGLYNNYGSYGGYGGYGNYYNSYRSMYQ